MRRALGVALFILVALPSTSLAASLSLSPSNGSYKVGDTIAVKVLVSSQAEPINAVSGTLTFTSSLLTIESILKTGSVLNFWPAEPSTSQSGATAVFEGVSLTGYQGASGVIVTTTFRATKAGVATISFKNGQVLANDGNGTDITSGLSGATFTINERTAPQPSTPPAPAETPTDVQGPTITSSTHPNQNVSYRSREVVVSWQNRADTTAVRIGYDKFPSGRPTVIYEPPISTKSLTLKDGVWYFHAQERTASGWGAITTFKIRIDQTAPPRVEVPLVTATTTATTSASTSIAPSTTSGEILETKEPWITPDWKINHLSLLAFALALALALACAAWYISHRFHTYRGHVLKGLGRAHGTVHAQFEELKQVVTEEVNSIEEVKTRRALTLEEQKLINRLKRMLDRTEKTIEDEIDSIVK